MASPRPIAIPAKRPRPKVCRCVSASDTPTETRFLAEPLDRTPRINCLRALDANQADLADPFKDNRVTVDDSCDEIGIRRWCLVRCRAC